MKKEIKEFYIAHKPVTKKDKEIAIRWASDTIRLVDVIDAMGVHSPSQAYIRLARALREIHYG